MPTVEFDHGSPFAGWHLFAVMHWPFDQLARNNFLVTVSAQIMQKAEDEIPWGVDRRLQDLARQLAAATGSSVEDARTRIKARTRDRVAATVSSVVAEVDRDLFRPSGGYGRVAAASGMNVIAEDARTGGRRFGGACGELLTSIVRLATHHPDMTASINRATYIMVNRAKKEDRTLPAERDRKTMWTIWGGVSPLWAAAALCETTAKARGSHSQSFHDAIFRQELVSASLWLADFAVGFKAIGAKGPLLSEHKVIRLNSNLAAVRPEIPPLTNEEFDWACAYKAPHPAQ